MCVCIGDVEESVRIDGTNVAGVEPALSRYSRVGALCLSLSLSIYIHIYINIYIDAARDVEKSVRVDCANVAGVQPALRGTLYIYLYLYLYLSTNIYIYR